MEMQKLASLTGAVNAQQFAAKAKTLFGAMNKLAEISPLSLSETNIVVATMAHNAALYAYLAAGVDHSMYRLYGQIHEHFADSSSLEDVRRDHVYRAVWGYAHHAQRFQNRDQEWGRHWSDLVRTLQRAEAIAHPDHVQALATYVEIAKAGPPVEPMNLDEVLRTLDPVGAGETFRAAFMAELQRFLGTKEKEFPPDQQLTFAPFTLTEDGSRAFWTKLNIKDSDGRHHEYPIEIQVNHLSGYNEESSAEVGTTVVSIMPVLRATYL
jgi:hypothetical protein